MTDDFPELDLTKLPYALQDICETWIWTADRNSPYEVRVSHDSVSFITVADGMTRERALHVDGHIWRVKNAARRLTGT
jgi:hypothetical protein